MTAEIDTILNTIAATGATESSDPLRAYIASLDAQIDTLSSESGAQATRIQELEAQLAESNRILENYRVQTGITRAAVTAVITAAQSYLSVTQE